MILLIGGTGFTGKFVLKELLDNGFKVRCLVRTTSKVDQISDSQIEFVHGDISNKDSVKNALEGISTVICVASLGFGHTPNIIAACEESKIERAVFFSTTGIFTSLNPKSKAIRIEAERLICSSNLNYTIIRPTMIYGTKDDRNMCRLIKFIDRYPIIPVLGKGNNLQQPVYVKDLAIAVIRILNNSECIKKEYNLAGAEELSYNKVIDTICQHLNKRIIKIHIPLRLCTFLLGIYEKLIKNPKLKKEQALRLNEDKNFSIKSARDDFGYSPINFSEGIKKEIYEIKKMA